MRYGLSPDRVRYGPSPTPVSSHPGPPRRPHVSAMVTVGCAEDPSSAMPRPNMACSRRRQRRFTNVYSYVWPWRFIMARSAARLRPRVGPLSPRNAAAEETRQKERPGARHHRKPGIFRAYSGHIPDIFRTFPGLVGHERIVVCRIVRRRIACDLRPVACAIVRRRVASPVARRVPYRPSPGTASGKVIACGIASRRIACGTIRRPSASRHVSARVGDLGVSAVVMVG